MCVGGAWRDAGRHRTVGHKTAEVTVQKALADAREQINTQLDERRSALAGQAEVFVGNAGFRSGVESQKLADVLDQSQEAVAQIGANWVQITNDRGVRLAKSNEPGADTVDLSGSALISGALEGESKGGYGVDANTNTLFQTVAVPIQGTTKSHVVGVLMAVRLLDSTFAVSLRATGGSGVDIALFITDTLGHAHLTASTAGRSADLDKVVGGLKGVPPTEAGRADSLSREVTMSLDVTIGGTNFVALGEPLRSASGAQVGGFIVLRNKDAEFAAFYRFATSSLVAAASAC